jgi:hypothetical protein
MQHFEALNPCKTAIVIIIVQLKAGGMDQVQRRKKVRFCGDGRSIVMKTI